MLPKILTDTVNTKKEWEKCRRPELVQLFQKWVYGVTPKEPLDEMKTTVIQTEILMENTVRKEVVYIELRRMGKTCGFHCRVFSSVNLKIPAPAVIMLNPFSKNKQLDYPGKDMDHMPYDLITACGYIGIHADVDELCADAASDYQKGLWELYLPTVDSETKIDKNDTWGSIGMWAFAGSRIVDYLEMRNDVDCGKIAVCGCSRAGKTALWCGAQDERISLVISNVSGCTGAAITRGKSGEHIRDIITQFPHWMCGNYASFSEREEELPVDQHMLLALCAPRPLYVSSASEDIWADPRSEFESAYLASIVYALYDRTGLEDKMFPEVDTFVGDGFIGYHNRTGIHGCRRYDWEQYLQFMKRFFNTNL